MRAVEIEQPGVEYFGRRHARKVGLDQPSLGVERAHNLARLIQPGMAQELGVTVVVENRAGASSNIGTQFVASAQPDGCTLLLGNNTGVAINRNLYTLRIEAEEFGYDGVFTAEVKHDPFIPLAMAAPQTRRRWMAWPACGSATMVPRSM